MQKTDIKKITTAAVIAAAYAAVTYVTAGLGLAYGAVQFRIAEAFFVFTAFTPSAAVGLTLGCALANLFSPYGLIDITLGAAATLISCIITRFLFLRFKKSAVFFTPLVPTLVNALAVGAEIAYLTAPSTSSAFGDMFFITAAQVGAGEAAVCFALGIPLFYLVKRIKLFER